MMKIITWNIRGLNGRYKQRILRNCVKEKDPDMFLLQETKCVGDMVEEKFKRCWRHCNFIYTESKGAVRGLAILWNITTVILEPYFSTVGMLTANCRAIGSSKSGSSPILMALISLKGKITYWTFLLI